MKIVLECYSGVAYSRNKLYFVLYFALKATESKCEIQTLYLW